jgi:hypothetical protein
MGCVLPRYEPDPAKNLGSGTLRVFPVQTSRLMRLRGIEQQFQFHRLQSFSRISRPVPKRVSDVPISSKPHAR